ncbi:MAG: aldo/keto reductase [Actinobacteria bacterium]|nr:aldo/keto reductase [Actinomycetota bacterium]
MRLPILPGQSADKIDLPQATKMLTSAIDAGVNYVDTAWPYHGVSHTEPGASELFVGMALADGLRDRVLLATKMPSWLVQTRGDMDRFLDQCVFRPQLTTRIGPN